MDIKNNVAAVTGGASGLGRAAVEHFVANASYNGDKELI